MPEQIRWGIIAPGAIAGQFAAAMKVVKNAEVLAVASRSEERAREFAQKFSIARVHTTYKDLASDPDIDAIYIASPHVFHAEQTLLCLEHKKAVLCEKPLTVNAKQARTVIKAAEANNVFLMEALWTRFLPAIQEVQSHMEDIGELRRIDADFSFCYTFSKEHRIVNPDLAGGSLLDLGVYILNFARIFSNDWPQDMVSVAQIGETGVDLQASILLKYANGLIAKLSCASNVPGPLTAELYGSTGSIKIPHNFFAAQQAVIKNEKGEHVIKKPFRKNGFEYEIEEVNSCLRKGRCESSIMSWNETLKIMEQMDALRSQWGLKYPFE